MSEAPVTQETPSEAPAPSAAPEIISSSAPPVNEGVADWRTSISDEALRAEAAIANYATVDDLVKGHLATKALASSKLTMPGDNDDSRKAFGDALRPQDAAAYEITVPEGMPAEFSEAARQKFFDMGVPPHWAKELSDWNNDYLAGELAKAETASAEDVAVFKKAYGANYDAQLNKVGVMFKAAGMEMPKEDLAELDAKLGSSNLLKFVFDIADRVGPLDHIGGDDNPIETGGVAPDQADAKLKELQADASWRSKALVANSTERKEYERLTRLSASHRAKMQNRA